MGAASLGAVEAHEGGGAEVAEQVGVEGGAAPPAAVSIVDEGAIGREVAGRRGEEEEAARDHDADPAVEGAAWPRGVISACDGSKEEGVWKGVRQ